MIAFVLVSALLIALALMILLRPMLRRQGEGDTGRRRAALKQALDAGVLDREEYATKLAALDAESPAGPDSAPSSQVSKITIAAIAILLPLGVFGIYRLVGRPDAVGVAPVAPSSGMSAAADATTKPAMDMDKAIERLRAKLEKNPDDAEGWLLLGRAYESVGRNEDGNKALAEAYKRAPTRPEIEIAYAESIALTSASRRLEGEPLRMIRHALERDPKNQDGLWLLGMSEYQNGRYAEAIAAWEKVRSQLGPDSDVLGSVTEMIGKAKAQLGSEGVADTAAAETAQTSMQASASPRLRMRVELSPAQRANAAPDDTVFVFAKAVSGPPMPLAIRRLQVSQLPADVELSDEDAMVAEMSLSKFPKVVLGARVSKRGDAMPQPGDLESAPLETDVAGAGALVLTIDRVRR